MKTFRLRSQATIEAMQWFSNDKPPQPFVFEDDWGTYVKARGGMHQYLKEGNWIIKDHDGVHYDVCPQGVFERIYAEVVS